MRSTQTGFTLLELLVVIAIVAVLAAIGIPSFRDIIRSGQSREAATAFYSALARARSEAIARNGDVSVCARDLTSPTTLACGNAAAAWKNGWIVYQGATPTTPFQVHDPIADDFTLGAVASPVVFDSAGHVPAATQFDLCRGTPDAKGRRITVSRSGRVSLELSPC